MKLTTEQLAKLRQIVARQYGAVGCNIPLKDCMFLVNAGLAEVRATAAGLDLVAGGEAITSAKIEGWVRGWSLPHGRRIGKKRRLSYSQALTEATEEARRKKENDAWMKAEEERLDALRAVSCKNSS